MRFKPGDTLLFIGDSITDCGRTNHLPPFGGGYMNMFRNMILTEYPDLKLSFVNKGISGNTLKGLELRWKKDVLNESTRVRDKRVREEHKVTHLFLMIGINDAAMQLNSSRPDDDVLDEFELTYEKLLRASLEKDMKIHCMTPFYISTDASSSLFKMNLRYIERIEGVCARLELPLLNIHNLFQEKLRKSMAEYWSGDGVHPYEHGHMLIARELFREIIND